MIYNTLEDISLITTLPLKTLVKISNKAVECICNNVYESNLAGDNTSNIDVGIGKLNISITKEGIKYTFNPSKDLELKLKETIITNTSPLVKDIEEGLAARILNTYKDLI